jgi:hypothetical protein
MLAGIFAHEHGIAIAAAVPATQIGVDYIIGPRDFGPDQGGPGGDGGYLHGMHSGLGSCLSNNYIKFIRTLKRLSKLSF